VLCVWRRGVGVSPHLCHRDGEVADLRVGRLPDFPALANADLGHALEADSSAWPGLLGFGLAFSVFWVGWWGLTAKDVLAFLVQRAIELEDL
jgi:hypothetical protein